MISDPVLAMRAFRRALVDTDDSRRSTVAGDVALSSPWLLLVLLRRPCFRFSDAARKLGLRANGP